MSRRGLTLLEVVAATALLAIIAAACVPLLAEARRWSDAVSAPSAIDKLILIADAVMLDPASFGIDSELMKVDGFETTITLDSEEAGSGESVRVQLLPHDNADHAWLRFELGDQAVLRFIALPEQDDAAPTEAQQ